VRRARARAGVRLRTTVVSLLGGLWRACAMVQSGPLDFCCVPDARDSNALGKRYGRRCIDAQTLEGINTARRVSCHNYGPLLHVQREITTSIVWELERRSWMLLLFAH